MSISILVAMGLAVPLMVLPLALVWFLNTGGLVAIFKEGRGRKKGWAI